MEVEKSTRNVVLIRIIEKLKIELQTLIQGKGVFRRFKDYCFESNIIQDWYKYKEQKYKEIAIEWCKQNELEYK